MRLAVIFNLLIFTAFLLGGMKLAENPEREISSRDVPPRILRLIQVQFPESQIVRAEQWRHFSPNRYLLRLENQGRTVRVVVQKPDRLLEVRRQLHWPEVPLAIKQIIQHTGTVPTGCEVWQIKDRSGKWYQVRTGSSVILKIDERGVAGDGQIGSDE